MVKSRLNDLIAAKELLRALGLEESANVVEVLEDRVRARQPLSWPNLVAALQAIERETDARRGVLKETYALINGMMLKGLDASGGRSRAAVRMRALTSPPLDRHVQALKQQIEPVLAEIQEATRKRTFMLLTMNAHTARWQTLERMAVEWVGHWARGMAADEKNRASEALCTIKFAKKVGAAYLADTRLYRDAMAHGGWEFEGNDKMKFWNVDDLGRRHNLPPLNDGDLLGLNNLTEMRFRLMEAATRVLRAWGRHAS